MHKPCGKTDPEPRVHGSCARGDVPGSDFTSDPYSGISLGQKQSSRTSISILSKSTLGGNADLPALKHHGSAYHAGDSMAGCL